MSLISRISSGLVFKDTFSSDELNPVWQVSPSDPSRYSLTEKPGYLRLKHGDPDLFVLMNAPRFDFVLEMDTDYAPIRASDQGGIAAYQSAEARIELLEYYDPATGTAKGYNRLRLVKRAEIFEGFGSNDDGNTWELIGVSFMNAPKIGFVLHGQLEAESDTLDIAEARLYRDTSIHVGNLRAGQVGKLIDTSGSIIGSATCGADSDHIKINGINLTYPFTGKICIFDESGFVLDETEILTDLWGGDVFWYGVKLDLQMDDLLLRQDREFQLGNMSEGIIERKMYVVNNNDIPIHNVKAKIMAMEQYYGWEWADVALDAYDFPGTYQEHVLIGTIPAHERVAIWVKVVRQPHQQVASLNDYKFRITLESG